MRPVYRVRLVAASLAIVAAFLWATYYLFVLAVSPGTRPSAVLFYPFLGGAAAYLVWVLARRQLRPLGRMFLDPGAYARLAFLLGTQVSILAATFLTGPVDASLLSLLGDVVVTPVLAAALVAGPLRELASRWFVAGSVLSLAGGTLAIVGGHGISAVHGVSWLVVVTLPLTVALYFVLSARAGRGVPVPVVVAHSMAAAAVGSLALAPLVPGGLPGIAHIGPDPLALLLVNGVASFFVAPFCYFRAIERAGLVFPPMLMTGIPVFTLLLSAAVLGLAPPLLGLLGVPVAAAGGVLALAAGARDGAPAGGPATASR